MFASSRSTAAAAAIGTRTTTSKASFRVFASTSITACRRYSSTWNSAACRRTRRVSGGRESGARSEGAVRVRCLAVLLLVAWCAVPQEFDREKSAREYVQFLVVQLDQWSREFPQQFYAALMKPPVDSSKMSDSAKSGAADLGESIKKLVALSTAPDLMTNAEFRVQVEKTLAATKEMNQAMS